MDMNIQDMKLVSNGGDEHFSETPSRRQKAMAGFVVARPFSVLFTMPAVDEAAIDRLICRQACQWKGPVVEGRINTTSIDDMLNAQRTAYHHDMLPRLAQPWKRPSFPQSDRRNSTVFAMINNTWQCDSMVMLHADQDDYPS